MADLFIEINNSSILFKSLKILRLFIIISEYQVTSRNLSNRECIDRAIQAFPVIEVITLKIMQFTRNR